MARTAKRIAPAAAALVSLTLIAATSAMAAGDVLCQKTVKGIGHAA